MTTAETTPGLRYLANCSRLFAELPLLQRPAAAVERVTNVSMGASIAAVTEFEALAESGQDAPTAVFATSTEILA